MQNFEVCATSDLKEGELKEMQLNDDVKILLLLKDGKFYASGTKCTHYGAPLAKGSHCGTKIRCPWHGANFDLTTGEIEDFPGCGSIATYPTEVKNGKVHVTLDPAVAKDGKRVAKLAEYKPTEDKRTFVVVGGGAAGQMAVQTLRENGFHGRVVLVSQEKYLPYDRVKLSKQPDTDASKIALKNADFYKSASIELMLETSITKIDSAAKEITISNGKSLKYDSLLIATGGRPRTMEGAKGIKGIHVLRSPDDGKALVEDSKEKNVVILGAGFIGLELAHALGKGSASMTLLARDPIPLKQVFGEKIGKLLLGLAEASGVKYRSGVSIREFQSKNGQLTGVVLTNGETLQAEVCLLAIGIEPATDFVKGTGVNMDEQGYIEVDSCMRTNVAGIFAAGDIIDFPLPLNVTGGVARKTKIGHWGVAQTMGKIAALNMLGRDNSPFISVPFFFTMMYNKGIRFAGDTTSGFSDVIIHGEMESYKWVAYFVEKGDTNRIVAVSTMGMDPIASHFAQLLASGRQLSRSEIEADTTATWVNKL